MQRVEFSSKDRHKLLGMGDFLLISPDKEHEIELLYEGEPPHGDSYHLVAIDGNPYPGYAWGCMFGFSLCSRYFSFSAMPTKYERRTAVVDLSTKRHYLLPEYIYQFRLDWPVITGDGPISSGLIYKFDGRENWTKI